MRVTEYQDPLDLAFDIGEYRVKAMILWELEKRKKEIGRIAYALPTIDRLLLRDELQSLTALGLVSTIVHKNVKPMQIEYALTNRGAKFSKCLRIMNEVGIEIMAEYGLEDILRDGGFITYEESAEAEETKVAQDAETDKVKEEQTI